MQFTPNDRLDLEYATCEMVNVSYALISKDSISTVTSAVCFWRRVLYNAMSIRIIVLSGYPEQLYGHDISFSYTEDLRFRKHAMVNISWSRPRGIVISELHVLNLVTCVTFRLSNYRAIPNNSF